MITSAQGLGTLLGLLSVDSEFTDVLDILPHVSTSQALVEIFGMYDQAFKVGVWGWAGLWDILRVGWFGVRGNGKFWFIGNILEICEGCRCGLGLQLI